MSEDNNLWLERRLDESSPTVAELRFGIDQSRLIHSTAFRRLQGKTQVIGVNEHDFFRTRLTHSLEVAQIGKRLCSRVHWLYRQENRWPGNRFHASLLPTSELVETACYGHDIGHPAFGHNGEKILNYFMHDKGGFEGNGQSLRVLSRLGEYSNGYGYNLCRRTLLAILKYPVSHEQCQRTYPLPHDNNAQIPLNIDDWTPPKCIHEDETDVLEWILHPFSNIDRDTFQSLIPKGDAYRSQYHSFDCSIMELADDIAYSIHDLEDAIAIGLLDINQVVEDLGSTFSQLSLYKSRQSDCSYYEQLFISGNPSDLKRAITNIVKYFIDHSHIIEQQIFESPLLDFQLALTDEASTFLDQFKEYVFNNVIDTAALKTIEFKGQKILGELFQAISTKPEKLLPPLYVKQLDDEPTPRVICDYLATATDREAGRLYERLFLPSSGSIFQPL